MEKHPHPNDVLDHAPELGATIPPVLPNESDGKHHSITQSLALEHQLNSELDNEVSHSATMKSHENEPFPSPSSLNPEVLHSIVVELRDTLKRERDNFATALHDAVTKSAQLELRNADLEENYNTVKARADVAEGKLVEMEQKYTESEQSLTMLRSKLEDSRRSIMRLQSDLSKRASTLGTSTSQNTKRMSLAGSGSAAAQSRNPSHRRISSMTDNLMAPSSPPPQTLPVLDISLASPTSPPLTPIYATNPSPRSLSPPVDTLTDQLHPSAAEIASLQAELSATKVALMEAKEARQASEDCLRALREFIASSSSPSDGKDGLKSPDFLNIQLPPLPTDTGVDKHGDQSLDSGRKAAAGWGLRLWKDSSSSSASSTPSLSRPSIDRTQSYMYDGSPTTGNVPLSSATSINQAPPPPSSFRSKLGFFSKVAPSAFAFPHVSNPSVSSQDSGAARSPGDRMSVASLSSRTIDSSSEEGPHTDDDLVPVILPKDSGNTSDDVKTPVHSGGHPDTFVAAESDI